MGEKMTPTLDGKLRCLQSLLQQMGASVACKTVGEARDALLSAHLTQPAQAVDVGAAAEVWHCAHCDISDIARNATDERIKRRAERVKSWMERNRPATLPGDNGEEG